MNPLESKLLDRYLTWAALLAVQGPPAVPRWLRRVPLRLGTLVLRGIVHATR